MTDGARRRFARFTKTPLLLAIVGNLLPLASGVACARPGVPDGVVESHNGMVVCVSDPAAQVGVDILQRGGNAVDAAVAVAFAMAVTYPPAGNIGGGGFMLVYPGDEREPVCIDYRETAPLAATEEMLVGVSRDDAKMVGVPGTVRGLELAHLEYGTMPWADLVQPAAELAQNGCPISASLAASLNDVLERYPKNRNLKNVFGPPFGQTKWTAGDVLKQEELAKTLRLIASDGANAFYQGIIATQIVVQMTMNGGIINSNDLGLYAAQLRKPIHGTYHGYDVYAAPPPSSGGIALVQMLNMLEGFNLRRQGRWSTTTQHLMIECMRRAYRDRAAHLGDPDYVEIPPSLTSKDYARKLAGTIDRKHATPSVELAGAIPLRAEGDSTTHFSIIDKNGMAVSNTYTLEQSYGSKIVVTGGGFLLNNEMGDFNRRPGVTDEEGHIGTAPNLIAPGKRMLSSQTPTIVARDGKAVLVTGSPGGRTIINTVLGVVLNVIEFDMNVREAVDAPRLHHGWLPDYLQLEAAAGPIDEKTLNELRAMGHTIRQVDSDKKPYVQGDAHTIFVKDGIYYGAADERIDGAAIGY